VTTQQQLNKLTKPPLKIKQKLPKLNTKKSPEQSQNSKHKTANILSNLNSSPPSTHASHDRKSTNSKKSLLNFKKIKTISMNEPKAETTSNPLSTP
jgi:vesicle coat complex subunit